MTTSDPILELAGDVRQIIAELGDLQQRATEVYGRLFLLGRDGSQPIDLPPIPRATVPGQLTIADVLEKVRAANAAQVKPPEEKLPHGKRFAGKLKSQISADAEGRRNQVLELWSKTNLTQQQIGIKVGINERNVRKDLSKAREMGDPRAIPAEQRPTVSLVDPYTIMATPLVSLEINHPSFKEPMVISAEPADDTVTAVHYAVSQALSIDHAAFLGTDECTCQECVDKAAEGKPVILGIDWSTQPDKVVQFPAIKGEPVGTFTDVKQHDDGSVSATFVKNEPSPKPQRPASLITVINQGPSEVAVEKEGTTLKVIVENVEKRMAEKAEQGREAIARGAATVKWEQGKTISWNRKLSRISGPKGYLDVPKSFLPVLIHMDDSGLYDLATLMQKGGYAKGSELQDAFKVYKSRLAGIGVELTTMGKELFSIRAQG